LILYAIVGLIGVNIILIILGISFLRKNTEDMIKQLDESIAEALIDIVENFKTQMPMSGDQNPIHLAIASMIQGIANKPPSLTAEVITRDITGKFAKDTSLSTEA
tara:strand:+ start:54 stop:368 length:315 start_codon:yes stop_codon:yes gene_type:complete